MPNSRMTHVRLSPALNFQFGAFTVLVLLIHSCKGQTQVIGPAQTIVATVGEAVVLPSLLDPVMDAFGMTVEWTRPALNPSFVFVWRDGVELESKKHPLYEGRTSVFTEELKRGNISLKLSRVRISDEGRYRCFIPALDKDYTVQLVVGAASSPVVQKTKNSSRVVLQCESTGWYPEPEMFWLDGEGNLLSAGPTETVRGPDDLYTVSSRVTVEKRHSNSFTCRVQQNHTNQTREAQIHVPDDFFAGPSGSSSSLPVIIGLILSIVFVLVAAAAVVVWKWRQNKIRNKKQREDEEGGNSPELKLLMGGDTDGKHPTEETETVNNVDEVRGEPPKTVKMVEERQKDNNQQTADETEAQSLTEEDKHGEQQTAERETLRDREKEDLKKKLKTKEREQEKFEKQVSRYEGQVKDKERQINEVKQQLEEVKTKEEDDDLKRKKEGLQEQLKKLETTLINTRQKKRKATKEREEIIKKLNELEKQNNQSDPVDSLIAGLTMMDVK